MTVRDGKLTVWGIFGKVILGSFGVYIVFTFVCLRDNEPRSTHSFAMGIIATTSQLCALFAETHSWKSIHVRSVHTCYMYISICKYVHIYMYIIYITIHSHTYIYIYIFEKRNPRIVPPSNVCGLKSGSSAISLGEIPQPPEAPKAWLWEKWSPRP